MTPAAPTPIERRIGRYRLERRLGEGGMGVVWAVTDVESGRRFALKTLKPHARGRPDLERRLMREARAAGAVHHPNVVTVHEVFDAGDDGPAIVMDLLEGETLRARLAREERLSAPDVARILLPVVSAVTAAHAQGVVHRDLKPDNIFLSRHADGSEHVRVLDFGIAKLVEAAADPGESQSMTSTGTMLGTPWYMAPEQGFGESDIDGRADVWAIGVILYECLSGGRPLEGDNLGQVLKRLMSQGITPVAGVVPDVPADVAELVDRMLTTDRDDRLSDLRTAQAVLERHTHAAPADTSTPLVVHRAARPARRAPIAYVTAASLVAIGFAVFGISRLRHSPASDAPRSTVRSPVRSAPAAGDGPAPASARAGPSDLHPIAPTPKADSDSPERAPTDTKLLLPHQRRRHASATTSVSAPTPFIAPAQPVSAAPAAAASAVPASTILGGLAARPPF
ncbi:MAG TPA: serine/threonine-protein kinase [Polyangiaceae bacterium]|nr:serine/threonine-protein kinase [Polyangiaceae bacterium]